MSVVIHLWQLSVVSSFVGFLETHYYQYHTKYPTNNMDHTCIYHYFSTPNGRGRELVPYCIRMADASTVQTEPPCYGKNFTFAELKLRNITAVKLMKWFAPVDLISDYEDFLVIGTGEKELFCNCSHTDYSFGTRCQYQFAINSSSFSIVVNATFSGKNIERDIQNLTEENGVTCCSLDNCTTYTGFCLDWRQVCDGRRDCINGRDEEWCLEKELNDCDEKLEYRCRSGHCIPRTFSFDLTIDCPDWDDEQDSLLSIFRFKCSKSPSVVCEEHACGLSGFSCGDGDCFQRRIDFLGNERCNSWRHALLVKRVYAYQVGLSIECWHQMICQIGLSCLFELPIVGNSSCQPNGTGTARFCYEVNTTSASCFKGDYSFFPSPSMVYPFVQLLYGKVSFKPDKKGILHALPPHRICYNTSACDIQPWNPTYQFIEVQGYHCYYLGAFSNFFVKLENGGIIQATIMLKSLQEIFSHCSGSLPYPNLYRCPSGLQISPHRLQDTFDDCSPSNNDEFNTVDSCMYNLTNRLRCLGVFGGPFVCIPKRLLHDGYSNCQDGFDELFPAECTSEYDCQLFRDFDLSKSYPFVYEEICDGFDFNFMGNIMVEETDETDCALWPCQARFHRCNGIWNRQNGCDELDCHGSVPTYLSQVVGNCSINEHYCLHLNQPTLGCLSVKRAGDRVIDCLLAMDEQRIPYISYNAWFFGLGTFMQANKARCRNATETIYGIDKLCNRKSDCPLNDDELLCSWHFNSTCPIDQFTCKNGTCLPRTKRCNGEIDCWPEAEDEWACDLMKPKVVGKYRPFTLTRFSTEPNEEQTEPWTLERSDDTQSKEEKVIITDAYAAFYCHRGILLRRKDGNDSCLCPPSYYGIRCEFQSGRLAITFQTEMPPIFDQRTIYHLLFLLLDHHHRVLTMETILHVPSKESVLKHFIYLLYPCHNVERLNNSLFVQIEAYAVTFTEVRSVSIAWYYQVQFPFLPMNRLALKLDLEAMPLNKTLCDLLGCIHGLCMSYVNARDRHFCLCNQGWTGPTCNEHLTIDHCTQLKCDPSYSKCVVRDDRAVCLCTLGRIGHNCRVPYNACDGVVCENGGQCVSLDLRTLSTVCSCPTDYFGDVCQFKTASLIIQIPRTAKFIPVLIAHFLHTPESIPGTLSHRNAYFLKNIDPGTQINIRENLQQILPPIIIVQIFVDVSSSYGSYYLLSLLNQNRTSLTKPLVFENRCIHVSERLNSSIMNFTWLKRVKLYHHFFKDVRCFFDEIYMCLVDQDQLIECLIFNHEVTRCTGRYYCAHGGRCLESKRAGQVQFACVCPECHYGTFCQLTMTEYSLTLDSIASQEILTDVSLDQQKPLIKILLALIVSMLVVGTISNICSSFTFSHNTIRSSGCGYYLFILSIASQCSLIIFVFRFIYLLVSQISIVSNRQFLNISCMLFDFLLQLSISFCDWLFVCIAVERTICVIKGIHFNKALSVRMVKFVVPTLIVGLTATSIHQVFSRELIPDPRIDERLWCVIKFPKSWLKKYDVTMNLANSIVPFLINLISAVLLLINCSRIKQRATSESYINALKKQVKEHKDLIMSPILIISCKLPILILILVIKCIKYKWELYLSITCYFIALVPLTTTFAIFVLPSPSYVKVFNEKRARLLRRH